MRGEKNIGGWQIRKDVKAFTTIKDSNLPVG